MLIWINCVVLINIGPIYKIYHPKIKYDFLYNLKLREYFVYKTNNSNHCQSWREEGSDFDWLLIKSYVLGLSRLLILYQGISGSVNTDEWRGAVRCVCLTVCVRGRCPAEPHVCQTQWGYTTIVACSAAARRHCSTSTELWPGPHDGRVLHDST